MKCNFYKEMDMSLWETKGKKFWFRSRMFRHNLLYSEVRLLKVDWIMEVTQLTCYW